MLFTDRGPLRIEIHHGPAHQCDRCLGVTAPVVELQLTEPIEGRGYKGYLCGPCVLSLHTHTNVQ